jgi:hypothetical protein
MDSKTPTMLPLFRNGESALIPRPRAIISGPMITVPPPVLLRLYSTPRAWHRSNFRAASMSWYFPTMMEGTKLYK